ncbi:TraR/DksA C4-type zinc finger protein [Candidatus Alkanophaga liquidiphilum]|nr:MAG: hypothetical protein DRN91_02610 [Candidatus Alkanophagales archaeon]
MKCEACGAEIEEKKARRRGDRTLCEDCYAEEELELGQRFCM